MKKELARKWAEKTGSTLEEAIERVECLLERNVSEKSILFLIQKMTVEEVMNRIVKSIEDEITAPIQWREMGDYFFLPVHTSLEAIMWKRGLVSMPESMGEVKKVKELKKVKPTIPGNMEDVLRAIFSRPIFEFHVNNQHPTRELLGRDAEVRWKKRKPLLKAVGVGKDRVIGLKDDFYLGHY